jgi:IS30 family transposase
VERKHRLYAVVKMPDKSAESMSQTAVRALGKFPRELRRTITYDNGTENAMHGTINQALGTVSYFCKPYHSWEKGSIENRNGVLRRFFPKKYNFCLTNQKSIDMVVNRINSAPMKCLGFRTPNEAFFGLRGVALRN